MVMCYITDMITRYVLKDIDTGEVLFVVVFTLLPNDQEDGKAKTSQSGEPNTDLTDGPPDKPFEPKAEDLD